MVAVGNPALKTFDEFVAWYPADSDECYELRRGVVLAMPKPRGAHSRLAGDWAFCLGQVIREAKQSFFVPKECLIRAGEYTGYEPDIVVLDETRLIDEPRWERESVIERGDSIRLVVEVVSTNWRDDYLVKLADYEAWGIQEYWIVDYLGLGGRRYLGSPKRPTVTVCWLVDGEYEMRQFRVGDRLASPTFPAIQWMLTPGFGLDG